MDSPKNKKLLKRVEEKELPAPDEKLLRAPTFWEKFPFLKSTYFLAAMILILVCILLVVTLKKPNNPYAQPQSPANLTPAPTSQARSGYTAWDRTDNWRTYTSTQGKFSLRYPSNLGISENAFSKNSVEIDSLPLPGMNENFKLKINYKNIQTGQALSQLISQNPVCPGEDTAPGLGANGSLNSGSSRNPAQFFIDSRCGKNIITAVYTKNNDILYIITLESQAKFGDIKPYADKLISTLKFSETSPAATCTPRPACLDSEPRCLMPESANMCPAKPTTPANDEVACTMDAMQCPDGSWVGRSGADCKFICPSN